MKIEPSRCPECGAKIRGTCDIVPATALLDEVAPGEFEYAGESKVHWDGQHTPETFEGLPEVICENGHIFPVHINEEARTDATP